jgi:dTDP-glucose pyrophosphorylase
MKKGRNLKEHLIYSDSTIETAIKRLEVLKSDAILFLTTDDNQLIGSITDGDIRRALLTGKTLNSSVREAIQQNPIFIKQDHVDIEKIIAWRNNNYKIIPILDENNRITDILNFRERKSYLPIDCVIMAGGKGERLRPLTESTPKPLLRIGEKPIIEHGIDLYRSYGISNFHVTTNYLGKQIESFALAKSNENLSIKTIEEPDFLGTIGSLKLIQDLKNDILLLANSDLLTNVDFEAFYLSFIQSNSDAAVLSVPYLVDIPYGVLNTKDDQLNEISEKPTYSYDTNGGMYLIKRKHIELLPSNQPFTAVEFINLLLTNKLKVSLFRHYGYWLDIGNHMDFQRAQNDVKSLFTRFE